MPSFNSRAVYVGFDMHEMTQRQMFLQALWSCIIIRQCAILTHYHGQAQQGAVPRNCLNPLLQLTHQTYIHMMSPQNTCLLTPTSESCKFSRFSMTNWYKHTGSACSLTSLDTSLASARFLWRSW
jgi:hypothetical protein